MEFLALEPLNILGLLGVGILSGILAGFFGIGGGAIIVPMMILFGFIHKSHPSLALCVFFIIGFTTMLAQPVTMVWAQRILPEYKSIAAGFINGFCVGVIALCMSVLGSIAQKFGIMNVLIVLSIIPAMSSYFVRYLKEELYYSDVEVLIGMLVD